MGKDKRGFRDGGSSEAASPGYPRWREPGAGERGTGAEGCDSPDVPNELPDLDNMPIPTSGMVPHPHDRGYADDEQRSLWHRLIAFLQGVRR